MQAKLKREDWKHTKHDFVVSRWEILIGPNDWEDHAYGKDGVERYRIHNLPAACSCCGLYELGVAFIPTTESHGLRKHDWDVITVYLGQADNIRTRLQEYGRTGSHLDHGNLIASRKNHESSSPQGLGLFKDIFSKGYSIMFRWAPIKSKMEAEKMEIELLRIFDYAWNRKGNGTCRHGDILAKLIHNSPKPCHSPMRRLLQWKNEAINKRVGVKIDESAPLFKESTPPHGLEGHLIPRIYKFFSSRIQVLPQDVNPVNVQICGVATGHGSVCINQPLPRRKRCAEHKGKKITASGSTSRVMTFPSDILLEDGAKGWELSKGIRVSSPLSDEICSPFQQNQSQSVAEEMFHHGKKEAGICGVVCSDGVVCMRSPVSGRQRCESHKGQRVCSPPSDEICSPFQQNQLQSVAQEIFHHEKKGTAISGVFYGDGIVCMRSPVLERQRCESHKGQRVRSFLSDEICSPFQQYQTQFHHDKKETGNCGVVDGDGYVCMRSPVDGRKRCERHKGQRVHTTTPVDKIFNSRQFNDRCRVIDSCGFACSRLPVPGRKRCEAHKGRRLV